MAFWTTVENTRPCRVEIGFSIGHLVMEDQVSMAGEKLRMTNDVSGSRSPEPVSPLPRQRLADLAYEEIRARIIRGDFPMGTRLNEVHIARDLGTSRAPVREAIRRLSEEGLTHERPHIGAVVREFDATTLVDLYNVRLALEKVAIRLGTRRRMNTDPLRALVTEMIEAARSGDHGLVARRELEFHIQVCDNCGNEVLANTFRSLEGQFLMAIAIDDEGFPDLVEVAREHNPLIEAIDSGDELAAEAEIERHILSTIGAVVERLGGTPDELIRSR